VGVAAEAELFGKFIRKDKRHDEQDTQHRALDRECQNSSHGAAVVLEVACFQQAIAKQRAHGHLSRGGRHLPGLPTLERLLNFRFPDVDRGAHKDLGYALFTTFNAFILAERLLPCDA
jgi:hypothetical protein